MMGVWFELTIDKRHKHFKLPWFTKGRSLRTNDEEELICMRLEIKCLRLIPQFCGCSYVAKVTPRTQPLRWNLKAWKHPWHRPTSLFTSPPVIELLRCPWQFAPIKSFSMPEVCILAVRNTTGKLFCGLYCSERILNTVFGTKKATSYQHQDVIPVLSHGGGSIMIRACCQKFLLIRIPFAWSHWSHWPKEVSPAINSKGSLTFFLQYYERLMGMFNYDCVLSTWRLYIIVIWMAKLMQKENFQNLNPLYVNPLKNFKGFTYFFLPPVPCALTSSPTVTPV